VSSGPERARERDFERFLTFVDAVVAIAITLLVLPLVDLAGELGDGGSVADLIGDHLAELGSAVLSFVVIARLWLAQHETVRDVVAQDRRVTQLMLLWLLLIVFLPVPTALLADGGSQALTKVLYIGTMAVSSFCVAGMALRIRNEPRTTPSRSVITMICVGSACDAACASRPWTSAAVRLSSRKSSGSRSGCGMFAWLSRQRSSSSSVATTTR